MNALHVEEFIAKVVLLENAVIAKEMFVKDVKMSAVYAEKFFAIYISEILMEEKFAEIAEIEGPVKYYK